MHIRNGIYIPSSEITPERVYNSRRQFLFSASRILGGLTWAPMILREATGAPLQQATAKAGPYDSPEAWTPEQVVTTYNQFYEFGTDKADPSRMSTGFQTKPWTVSVE